MVSMLVLAAMLLGLLYGYQRMQTWAYEKLIPYAVTISYSSETQANLNIQYDYGYGYLPEHQQVMKLSAASEIHEIAVSISAWKPLRKLRLWSTQAERLKIHGLSVRRADSILEARPTAGIASDNKVLIEVQINGDRGGL